VPTQVSPDPVPFGFLPGPTGLSAPLTSPDGSPATQAGSHPYQLTVNLAFPAGKTGGQLAANDHVHTLITDLPPGLLGNPAATPELCTEEQLTSNTACPEETQIGTITAMTNVAGPIFSLSPLYNMVPPPGAPAALAFNALGVGVFTHLIASVRSDGDYGVSTATRDFLSRPLNPVLAAQAQIWGDPSSKSHDRVRGQCPEEEAPATCPVAPQETAFLAMPGACGGPILTAAEADTWEQQGSFAKASYESADLGGNPKGVEGCNQLEFEPTIKASPTTNITDSPSGLDVDLHQLQNVKLSSLFTAALKDAAVTLPAGLVANVSQADGLAACTPAQIGLTTPIGQAPVHFSKAPDGCPDAAKLGTVEVATPLLAQYNEQHKLLRDPEENAIPEPLHGSIYIAKPFENPFGSLLAVYFSINDPKTGTVAKLAGKVEPNPVTGQLATKFTENPQLPLEDVKVHLFTGARASLQTPPLCGTHETTSELVPWSAPEGLPASPSAFFESTAAPGGGACPSTESAQPHAPAISAGTLAPAAGAYSPLLAKISRADGSQRLGRLELTLPSGVSAKLAGVAQCSEAQIAAAMARNHPNEGALERANPSCPAASEVGTADVGAGAGPTPFHTRGRLYLAGPYKGAPLSVVAITPAVAGPFDLGAVVVRSALYIDPETAQGRVLTDPLPTILEGIPVNVRSVAVSSDRPQFTRNPTSCDPKAFAGVATSTLGQTAPLSERFQVGGCQQLPFKPKLQFRLFGPIHRGGHPRFRTVLTAKPGEAGIARTVVALPHSEFIDQAHFRTICTRVQYAANQCPAGSVYGHIKAITPLLDYPLQGPVYLRSSSQELPDVVAALRGPASQPIAIDLVGHVDSVNGGIRFTFPSVPDAPVTKAIITAQGGKKGLFQNSTNICRGTHRVRVSMRGQNGKVSNLQPALKAQCPKGGGKGRRGR
jgi:hypothetical protein